MKFFQNSKDFRTRTQSTLSDTFLAENPYGLRHKGRCWKSHRRVQRVVQQDHLNFRFSHSSSHCWVMVAQTVLLRGVSNLEPFASSSARTAATQELSRPIWRSLHSCSPSHKTRGFRS